MEAWLVENMKSKSEEFYIELTFNEIRKIKSQIEISGQLIYGESVEILPKVTEHIEVVDLWIFPPTKTGLLYILSGLTGIQNYKKLYNLIK